MNNEIVVYQPNEALKLEVRLENETVWLNQQQMSELFQKTRNNVTLHIRNVFKENELDEVSVCKESLLTAADGTKYCNLDVIVSMARRSSSSRIPWRISRNTARASSNLSMERLWRMAQRRRSLEIEIGYTYMRMQEIVIVALNKKKESF